MINLDTSFFDWVKKALPSISYSQTESVKESINQFYKDGKTIDCITNVLDNISQGDIFDNVPFMFISKDGDFHVNKLSAMIISNTCDITRKEYVLFAPIIKYDGTNDDIKQNKFYEYMYIGDYHNEEVFVDFGRIMSLKRSILVKELNDNRLIRTKSLNRIGYYLFIIKLTVYLLRPEDNDNFNSREILN